MEQQRYTQRPKRQRTARSPFERLVAEQRGSDRRQLVERHVPSPPTSEIEAEVLSELPVVHADINDAIREWMEPTDLTSYAHRMHVPTTITAANPEPPRIVPPGLQVQENEGELAYEARMALDGRS